MEFVFPKRWVRYFDPLNEKLWVTGVFLQKRWHQVSSKNSKFTLRHFLNE